MDFLSDTIFTEPPFLDLGLPKRAPKLDANSTVAGELAKLEKSPGQLSDEIIAEIDSLHEATVDRHTKENKCAECWNHWPCATHRAIYGETKDSCVHLI